MQISKKALVRKSTLIRVLLLSVFLHLLLMLYLGVYKIPFFNPPEYKPLPEIDLPPQTEAEYRVNISEKQESKQPVTLPLPVPPPVMQNKIEQDTQSNSVDSYQTP